MDRFGSRRKNPARAELRRILNLDVDRKRPLQRPAAKVLFVSSLTSFLVTLKIKFDNRYLTLAGQFRFHKNRRTKMWEGDS